MLIDKFHSCIMYPIRCGRGCVVPCFVIVISFTLIIQGCFLGKEGVGGLGVQLHNEVTLNGRGHCNVTGGYVGVCLLIDAVQLYAAWKLLYQSPYLVSA